MKVLIRCRQVVEYSEVLELTEGQLKLLRSKKIRTSGLVTLGGDEEAYLLLDHILTRLSVQVGELIFTDLHVEPKPE